MLYKSPGANEENAIDCWATIKLHSSSKYWKASTVGYGNSCDEIIISTCKTLYPHHQTSKKRFWNGQTSSTHANKIRAWLYKKTCGRYQIKPSWICYPMCTCITSSLLFVLQINMSPMYQYWYIYTTILSTSINKTKCWSSHKTSYVYRVFWNIWFKTIHVSRIFVYSEPLLIWYEVLPTSYENIFSLVDIWINKYLFMSTWCFICFPLCRMHVLLDSFQELLLTCVYAKNPCAYILWLSSISQYLQFFL